MNFKNCILTNSSFYTCVLKKSKFEDCKLHEVDFTEANFSESQFISCDFLDAKFERTILEKANFSSAYNIVLDPEINNISKAKFSMSNVLGLLAKYNIDVV
jgi:uncharacterized protein YjbI with pentapeptide repeats